MVQVEYKYEDSYYQEAKNIIDYVEDFHYVLGEGEDQAVLLTMLFFGHPKKRGTSGSLAITKEKQGLTAVAVERQEV